MNTSPFTASTSKPGHGIIDVCILPPSTSVLRTLSYQYPLKLIAPTPVVLLDDAVSAERLIHTIFLLTYGGGLVAGDTIHLHVNLAPTTRLILLTQGSTKIFKSPRPDIVSLQHTLVDIKDTAALCYLADPVQPFEASAFEQHQTYNLYEGSQGNLCVCDWVSEGRTARGEKWAFSSYISRNEVWLNKADGRKRLMLRDNLILDSSPTDMQHVTGRVDGLGVFGTLILFGPLFAQLGSYFMEEFRLLPQIGARQWDAPPELTQVELERARRVERESADGVLWTAAAIRGFVVIKFGAVAVEGAKKWLRGMLKTEGSVERLFGDRALLCLR